MLYFDENELGAQLDRLPPERRALFAVGCAQRGVNTVGDDNARVHLQRYLDVLWRDVRLPRGDRDGIKHALAEVDVLASQDDTEMEPVLDDTCAAIAYALECRLEGESKYASSAARRMYSLATELAIVEGNIDVDAERGSIDSYEQVQRELSRQQRDLGWLTSADGRPENWLEGFRSLLTAESL